MNKGEETDDEEMEEDEQGQSSDDSGDDSEDELINANDSRETASMTAFKPGHDPSKFIEDYKEPSASGAVPREQRPEVNLARATRQVVEDGKQVAEYTPATLFSKQQTEKFGTLHYQYRSAFDKQSIRDKMEALEGQPASEEDDGKLYMFFPSWCLIFDFAVRCKPTSAPSNDPVNSFEAAFQKAVLDNGSAVQRLVQEDETFKKLVDEFKANGQVEWKTYFDFAKSQMVMGRFDFAVQNENVVERAPIFTEFYAVSTVPWAKETRLNMRFHVAIVDALKHMGFPTKNSVAEEMNRTDNDRNLDCACSFLFVRELLLSQWWKNIRTWKKAGASAPAWFNATVQRVSKLELGRKLKTDPTSYGLDSTKATLDLMYPSSLPETVSLEALATIKSIESNTYMSKTELFDHRVEVYAFAVQEDEEEDVTPPGGTRVETADRNPVCMSTHSSMNALYGYVKDKEGTALLALLSKENPSKYTAVKGEKMTDWRSVEKFANSTLATLKAYEVKHPSKPVDTTVRTKMAYMDTQVKKGNKKGARADESGVFQGDAFVGISVFPDIDLEQLCLKNTIDNVDAILQHFPDFWKEWKSIHVRMTRLTNAATVGSKADLASAKQLVGLYKRNTSLNLLKRLNAVNEELVDMNPDDITAYTAKLWNMLDTYTQKLQSLSDTTVRHLQIARGVVKPRKNEEPRDKYLFRGDRSAYDTDYDDGYHVFNKKSEYMDSKFNNTLWEMKLPDNSPTIDARKSHKLPEDDPPGPTTHYEEYGPVWFRDVQTASGMLDKKRDLKSELNKLMEVASTSGLDFVEEGNLVHVLEKVQQLEDVIEFTYIWHYRRMLRLNSQTPLSLETHNEMLCDRYKGKKNGHGKLKGAITNEVKNYFEFLSSLEPAPSGNKTQIQQRMESLVSSNLANAGVETTKHHKTIVEGVCEELSNRLSHLRTLGQVLRYGGYRASEDEMSFGVRFRYPNYGVFSTPEDDEPKKGEERRYYQGILNDMKPDMRTWGDRLEGDTFCPPKWNVRNLKTDRCTPRDILNYVLTDEHSIVKSFIKEADLFFQLYEDDLKIDIGQFSDENYKGFFHFVAGLSESGYSSSIVPSMLAGDELEKDVFDRSVETQWLTLPESIMRTDAPADNASYRYDKQAWMSVLDNEYDLQLLALRTHTPFQSVGDESKYGTNGEPRQPRWGAEGYPTLQQARDAYALNTGSSNTRYDPNECSKKLVELSEQIASLTAVCKVVEYAKENDVTLEDLRTIAKEKERMKGLLDQQDLNTILKEKTESLRKETERMNNPGSPHNVAIHSISLKEIESALRPPNNNGMIKHILELLETRYKDEEDKTYGNFLNKYNDCVDVVINEVANYKRRVAYEKVKAFHLSMVINAATEWLNEVLKQIQVKVSKFSMKAASNFVLLVDNEGLNMSNQDAVLKAFISTTEEKPRRGKPPKNEASPFKAEDWPFIQKHVKLMYRLYKWKGNSTDQLYRSSDSQRAAANDTPSLYARRNVLQAHFQFSGLSSGNAKRGKQDKQDKQPIASSDTEKKVRELATNLRGVLESLTYDDAGRVQPTDADRLRFVDEFNRIVSSAFEVNSHSLLRHYTVIEEKKSKPRYSVVFPMAGTHLMFSSVVPLNDTAKASKSYVELDLSKMFTTPSTKPYFDELETQVDDFKAKRGGRQSDNTTDVRAMGDRYIAKYLLDGDLNSFLGGLSEIPLTWKRRTKMFLTRVIYELTSGNSEAGVMLSYLQEYLETNPVQRTMSSVSPYAEWYETLFEEMKLDLGRAREWEDDVKAMEPHLDVLRRFDLYHRILKTKEYDALMDSVPCPLPMLQGLEDNLTYKLPRSESSQEAQLLGRRTHASLDSANYWDKAKTWINNIVDSRTVDSFMVHSQHPMIKLNVPSNSEALEAIDALTSEFGNRTVSPSRPPVRAVDHWRHHKYTDFVQKLCDEPPDVEKHVEDVKKAFKIRDDRDERDEGGDDESYVYDPEKGMVAETYVHLIDVLRDNFEKKINDKKAFDLAVQEVDVFGLKRSREGIFGLMDRVKKKMKALPEPQQQNFDYVEQMGNSHDPALLYRAAFDLNVPMLVERGSSEPAKKRRRSDEGLIQLAKRLRDQPASAMWENPDLLMARGMLEGGPNATSRPATRRTPQELQIRNQKRSEWVNKLTEAYINLLQKRGLYDADKLGPFQTAMEGIIDRALMGLNTIDAIDSAMQKGCKIREIRRKKRTDKRKNNVKEPINLINQLFFQWSRHIQNIPPGNPLLPLRVAQGDAHWIEAIGGDALDSENGSLRFYKGLLVWAKANEVALPYITQNIHGVTSAEGLRKRILDSAMASLNEKLREYMQSDEAKIAVPDGTSDVDLFLETHKESGTEVTELDYMAAAFFFLQPVVLVRPNGDLDQWSTSENTMLAHPYMRVFGDSNAPIVFRVQSNNQHDIAVLSYARNDAFDRASEMSATPSLNGEGYDNPALLTFGFEVSQGGRRRKRRS